MSMLTFIVLIVAVITLFACSTGKHTLLKGIVSFGCLCVLLPAHMLVFVGIAALIWTAIFGLRAILIATTH